MTLEIAIINWSKSKFYILISFPCWSCTHIDTVWYSMCSCHFHFCSQVSLNLAKPSQSMPCNLQSPPVVCKLIRCNLIAGAHISSAKLDLVQRGLRRCVHPFIPTRPTDKSIALRSPPTTRASPAAPTSRSLHRSINLGAAAAFDPRRRPCCTNRIHKLAFYVRVRQVILGPGWVSERRRPRWTFSQTFITRPLGLFLTARRAVSSAFEKSLRPREPSWWPPANQHYARGLFH